MAAGRSPPVGTSRGPAVPPGQPERVQVGDLHLGGIGLDELRRVPGVREVYGGARVAQHAGGDDAPTLGPHRGQIPAQHIDRGGVQPAS